ncbi:PAS domain-containing protein [Methylobacterium sp. J-076]|uniref:PAS domain-containing protein n=1 Tax=Methylobacterium sp. J-076 TaxID=2836655 RepID=UPI001FBBEE68|nr:PAS domain-containing protein [Methylobacterium sp. J-076]MCJ2013429.1 PAS domain-containing protein [Methylobacterium sp. J-076]
MHTDSTSQDGGRAGLAPAFALWQREPALAAALRDTAVSHLVLDGGDGTVRHASPAAARLGEVLAHLDGLAFARQLAAACPAEGGHRLVRLRLDPRRIAPPSLFTVSRAADADGRPVYLAIAAGTLALPRVSAAPAQAEARAPSPVAPPPAREPSPPAAEPPREGDRFLWRSDGHSVLTRLSGSLAGLTGQDWPGLAGSHDPSQSHPVIAALASRRTFRKLPISFRLGHLTIHAEVSGAPTAREGAEFRGFEGFGVIRGIARADAGPATLAADLLAFTSDEDAGTGTEAPPDGALSTDEHAAFREIARALGARYAGDDESNAPPPLAARMAGSVMPFPSPRADLAPSPPFPADETGGLLDSLPMPALVHRGETILAVNQPFLDLTRFGDLEDLRGAGIHAVFPSGPPQFRSGLSHETAIGTAGGAARPVEVTRGICAWEGGPAAILLLRGLDEDDPRRELAAERLAREVQAGRALGAEAALDALQAGVVTIDRDGRVVTLNRAAASCLGGAPTELVGSDFAHLFDAGSAGPLAAALAGGGEAPSAVLAQGRAMTLALAPLRADGERVAVLHRLPDSTLGGASQGARAEPAAPGTANMRRLDRELREPVDAILTLTHAMLEERFGALGDTRYRACLSDIRDAGERIVERMAELSDLAAIEAGQIALDPRPLALNEVVANCVAVLQTEAARGRIVLRTSFSTDLAELEVDEASVRRAASLVIEHAIRRSVAGGQVIVSTGTGEAAEVALRVRDGSPAQNAVAVAPEEDLRLALPRALVQANGGRLRMTGRGEEGMLVEILLPAKHGARG